MAPCLFWTFWLSLNLMVVCTPQFIENLPTVTYICSGIAIMPFQLNTMLLVPCIMGPELFVPALSSCRGKMIICTKSWQDVSTLYGFSTGWNWRSEPHPTKEPPTPLKVLHPTIKGLRWLFHTPKAKVRASRMYALNMGYKCTFRGCRIIRSLLVPSKDKGPNTKKSGVIYRYKCDRVECDEYIGGVFKKIWREVQRTP